VGDQRTGFIVRIEACNHKYPASDSLCKGAVAMEAKELVQEANAVECLQTRSSQ
jgi:hypothetical protein